MPALKVKVNTEAKSAGGQIYEGPTDPPRGVYTGYIQRLALKEAKSGNVYFNALVIFDHNKGEKAKYNGLPAWHMIHMTEDDNIQAELGMFMKAVTGKEAKEQNVAYEGTDADFSTSKGATVRNIGGVKPQGKSVKFDIGYETSEGYGTQMRLRNLRGYDPALTEGDAEDEVVITTDSEEEAEAEETDEDEVTREEREAELKKESLADLKAAALEAGIDIKGLKKADLIAAILDWEYEEADEDEEAEDEEVEEEAEESEVEEDEEDEEEEEEEEEEDEEEEEEDDEADPVEELKTELADLDRTALKARLKEADPEAKILKKHTDDDLRTAIVDALFPTPF